MSKLYCSYCGEDLTIKTIQEILRHLENHNIFVTELIKNSIKGLF